MLSYLFPLAYAVLTCATPSSTIQSKKVKAYKLTYYWLSHQKTFPGRRSTKLLYKKNKRTRRMWVTPKFARAIRMQGSARLRDGRIVQFKKKCRGLTSKRCLRVRFINHKRYPMGVGAAGVPLKPMISLAVDRRRLPLGSVLYIPALRKWLRTQGIKHDGCFRADDVGGGIKGAHLDLFVGDSLRFRRLPRHTLPRKVRIHTQHPQCTVMTAKL
ncbi:MAG: hypothetical protein CL920_14920 [Deltaproteobacteria bacterium]|nr:hypothetical protein [Deltaproteobacteria bacterium]